MADTTTANSTNAIRIGAGVLGILGGAWILGVAYFGIGMLTVFGGASGSQALVASLAAIGMPVASIVGGAIVFVSPEIGAALMLFSTAGTLGIYGVNSMPLAP